MICLVRPTIITFHWDEQSHRSDKSDWTSRWVLLVLAGIFYWRDDVIRRYLCWLIMRDVGWYSSGGTFRGNALNICYLPLTCGDRSISVYLGQYHGCWCPGSLRGQDISSHDIDYIEYVGPSLTWASVLSTCVKSMWGNDIKCKYMFMFPQKKLARKGLKKLKRFLEMNTSQISTPAQGTVNKYCINLCSPKIPKCLYKCDKKAVGASFH